MGSIFNNIPTLSADQMPEGAYLSFDFNENPAIQAAVMCKVVGGVIYVVNEQYTNGEWHT